MSAAAESGVAPGLAARLRGELDPLAALLLEHAADGLAILDPDARLLRHNARLGALLGGHPGLSQGAPIGLLFAAEALQAVAQAIAAASAGIAGQAGVVRLAAAPGEELFMEASLQPLWEQDGALGGLLLRLIDRTTRRRLQSQLLQGQKLQAVGQLAAGIAHDFNNLLTAIGGAAEAIVTRPGIDRATAEDAAEIAASADRGAALVHQLLAFGRQQDLRPCPIRLNEALARLAPLLARLLGRGVSVTVEPSPVEAIAAVDPTQFDQVVINLAVNARDAMPGGGTLTLRCGQVVLYRPMRRGPEEIPAGHYAMLEVQDTGQGIDPELLPRIFEPFFTTKRERGGTGLGLSTVHGIVRQSNGFLGVDSAPGRGTRFRIYLPRSTAPATIPGFPIPATIDPSVPSRRSVVLVDDETVLRRLAVRALEADGWSVLGADGAEEALHLVTQAGARLDLLITDVVMPGMDGPALAAALRRLWPGLPALFVSGYADAALRDSILADGQDLLAKPYRLADLTARARSMLACTTRTE